MAEKTPQTTSNQPQAQDKPQPQHLYRFVEKWGVRVIEAESLDQALDKRARELETWGD